MKLYIYFIFILLLLFGCGAQGTPQNNSPEETQDEEAMGVENSIFYEENSSILAQNIFINFPNSLEESKNSIFNKELKLLKVELFRIENIFFHIRKILLDIQTDCKEKASCMLEDKALNKFNNQKKNLSFKKINYSFQPTKSIYQYQIILNTNNNEEIKFNWDINSSNIKTDYKKRNSHINIFYLNDVNKEACYLYNHKETYHSFYLSNSDIKNYQLRSQHIYKNKSNFSTNMKFQYYEELLLVNNTFEIKNNINNKKEEVYFLLPPTIDIGKLTPIELPFQMEGSIFNYKNNIQGALYSDKFIENIDKLEVLYLDKNDILVNFPKISKNFTLY